MIALVGARSAGKTTAGRLAAKLMNRPFIDLDESVERETGKTIADLFAVGEPHFRAIESGCLARTVAAAAGNTILALGGGAPLELGARRHLARSVVIYLHARPETLKKRLRRDPRPHPPLLGFDAADEVDAIVGVRDPLYRGLADAIIDTDMLSLERVARAIEREASRLETLERSRARSL